MAQGGTKYSCLISIHALLAESDGESVVKIVEQWAFLSTLSLRRATSYPGLQSARLQNFYPRSPCGERRPVPTAPPPPANFYPRSPCGERLSTAIVTQHPRDFYPRSPCGERRVNIALFCVLIAISIHALLAESDSAARMLYQPTSYFYPRSPCGERPCKTQCPAGPVISIHALLAESDFFVLVQGRHMQISIHALLAESDEESKATVWHDAQISIHALLAESDHLRCMLFGYNP